MKNLKSLIALACALIAGSAVAQNPTSYVPKVYPQQQETVGKAVLDVTESGSTTEYTFRNSVLNAKFVNDGGKLSFGGSTAMNLLPGAELFSVKFGDGSKVVPASQMTLKSVDTEKLTANSSAVKGFQHFDGVRLNATFEYTYSGSKVTILWYAELRDGSHYLKTDLTLSADKNVKMFAIVPMQYEVDVTAAGSRPVAVGDSRLRGRVLASDKIFAMLNTPTGINTVGEGESATINPEDIVATFNYSWEPTSWSVIPQEAVPHRVKEQGYNNPNVLTYEKTVTFEQKGMLSVEFHYGGRGNHGLNICGVELEAAGSSTSDFHKGFAGGKENANVYSVDVTAPGTYTLRMYVENATEAIDSYGNIKASLVVKKGGESTGDVVPLNGVWSRNTTLEAGKIWNVGAVVGLIAKDQARRSVLAYVERERAVPWRPYPIYNSWYELNINRTNKNVDPANNLKVEQTVDVMKQWKKNMFDKYGYSIKAFVWDDGWDQYGTWDFNAGFPNGFSEPDAVGRQMCSGQGAWLGPCGGYDVAGNQRKAYWTKQGLECNLYNKKYYDVFVGACKRLCKDYDFRYFKFDGISSLGTAYGPNMNATNGEEDAEGIISVERDVRENIKEDIFFNTTVGTWASPLWFNISDAVWRQENDHSVNKGTNSISRENWITYRDELVYRHFVTESPLCPINSMMTHGFILTKYGESYTTGMTREYEPVKRELRYAFACGSGQVELYCDYALMNEINDGALWKDLADLIHWQREQADVLPDIHWVGGSPYDTKHNIYGWAAWNGNKAVLTLRNGSNSQMTYKFTLRKALDIPAGVNTTIVLTKPFADQLALKGLTEGTPINIDTELTVTLPGSSVYMFNGIDSNGELVLISDLHFTAEEVHVPAGVAKAPEFVVAPLDASNKTLTWTSEDTSIATVNDGAITGVKEGETTVTATANDGSGKTMSIKVIVEANVQNDLNILIEQAQASYDANEVVTYGGALITKASQFSSPNSQNDHHPAKLDGGNLKDGVLIDNNAATFWHTDYTCGDQTDHSHYLQVALDKEISGTVLLTFTRRNAANDQVTKFDVESSTDGKTFTHADYIDIPNSGGGQVEKKHFYLEQNASYLRFWVDKTTNNRGYWHCAEFQLNGVEHESVNSEHKTEADALLTALTEARKVKEATQSDVDDLRAAYDAYLIAIGEEPTGISPISSPSTQLSFLYDLSGRRVSKATRGLFVQNGHKVLR